MFSTVAKFHYNSFVRYNCIKLFPDTYQAPFVLSYITGRSQSRDYRARLYNQKSWVRSRGGLCPSTDGIIRIPLYPLLSLWDVQLAHSLQKRTYCAFHVLVQPNFRRYYFYFWPIKLRFSSIISTFKTNSDAKFRLDSTTDKEFLQRPPL